MNTENESPAIYINKGNECRDRQDYVGAIKAFTKAIDLYGEETSKPALLFWERAEVLSLKGERKKAKSDYDTAASLLEQGDGVDAVSEYWARVYSRRAETLLKQKQERWKAHDCLSRLYNIYCFFDNGESERISALKTRLDLLWNDLSEEEKSKTQKEKTEGKGVPHHDQATEIFLQRLFGNQRSPYNRKKYHYYMKKGDKEYEKAAALKGSSSYVIAQYARMAIKYAQDAIADKNKEEAMKCALAARTAALSAEKHAKESLRQQNELYPGDYIRVADACMLAAEAESSLIDVYVDRYEKAGAANLTQTGTLATEAMMASRRQWLFGMGVVPGELENSMNRVVRAVSASEKVARAVDIERSENERNEEMLALISIAVMRSHLVTKDTDYDFNDYMTLARLAYVDEDFSKTFYAPDLSIDKERFQSLIEEGKRTPHYQEQCGQKEYDAGNYEGAIGHFDAIIGRFGESNPRSIGSYIKRSMAYLRLEKYSHTIADCNMVLALDDTDGKSDNIAQALINRGTAFYEKKQYDKATADFERVLNEFENEELKASVLFHKGNMCFDRKDVEEAQEYYDLAIVNYSYRNPEKAKCRYNLSLLYDCENDNVGWAVWQCDEAICVLTELCPEATEKIYYRLLLGNLYERRSRLRWEQENYDGSVKDIDRAISIFAKEGRDVSEAIKFRISAINMRRSYKASQGEPLSETALTVFDGSKGADKPIGDVRNVHDYFGVGLNEDVNAMTFRAISYFARKEFDKSLVECDRALKILGKNRYASLHLLHLKKLMQRRKPTRSK